MSIYTLPKQLVNISAPGGTYILLLYDILSLTILRSCSEKHLPSFLDIRYFSPIAQIDSGHCPRPCCPCDAIGCHRGYLERGMDSV